MEKHWTGITRGENCIISPHIRFRYPELVTIGDNCVLDDYCYISTKLTLGNYSHICTGVKIIGGKNSIVEIGEFSSLSPNVVIAAGSDEYGRGFASCTIPDEFKEHVITGMVSIGKNCFIGSGSVIMPNVTIAEGGSVGALSFVNKNIEEYVIYGGVPARFIKVRDKKEIKRLEDNFRRSLC